MFFQEKMTRLLGQGSSNFFYIFLLDVNFENITVGLHVLYVLNIRVKFCSNRMLFAIRSINLFSMHNFRSQKLNLNI